VKLEKYDFTLFKGFFIEKMTQIHQILKETFYVESSLAMQKPTINNYSRKNL
jgi:hypothetical protein